eukprot:TRINITY_DN13408_c0_g1_i1.p2 TRINITY_DN13408_c0_g1~~TRINITY_DN13408_c0_g1_i1.p2  ORF type:complete len:142 (+),score=27.25 TRINITY_DN13408_c0_g1_i1:59-427(+)
MAPVLQSATSIQFVGDATKALRDLAEAAFLREPCTEEEEELERGAAQTAAIAPAPTLLKRAAGNRRAPGPPGCLPPLSRTTFSAASTLPDCENMSRETAEQARAYVLAHRQRVRARHPQSHL